MIWHVIIMIVGILIGATSQVLLKQSAMRQYNSKYREYLNVRVFMAYTFLAVTSYMSIYAYKKVPLSLGAILESVSYIYITIMGRFFFGERITRNKLAAIICILVGILLFNMN